jgi:hypothetical protein
MEPAGIGHPLFVDKLESRDGVCLELAGDDDCTTYETRPMMCRLYPFYIGVRADGTFQVSIDHCPGVGQPGAEVVDAGYVRREIISAVGDEAGFLSSLSARTVAGKGTEWRLLGDSAPDLKMEWDARGTLWGGVFSLLDRLPGHFTPRDRLECLKAELVQWVEQAMLAMGGQDDPKARVIGRRDVEGILSALEADWPDVSVVAAAAQEGQRRLLQESGQVTGGAPDGTGQTIPFRTRVGERFEVATREVLVMRALDDGAAAAERGYIREVVGREFVYQGVLVGPPTFREEAALLFYMADAVELFANAFAVRDGRDTVGVEEMNSGICEADAHILTTAQQLGIGLSRASGP